MRYPVLEFGYFQNQQFHLAVAQQLLGNRVVHVAAGFHDMKIHGMKMHPVGGKVVLQALGIHGSAGARGADERNVDRRWVVVYAFVDPIAIGCGVIIQRLIAQVFIVGQQDHGARCKQRAHEENQQESAQGQAHVRLMCPRN